MFSYKVLSLCLFITLISKISCHLIEGHLGTKYEVQINDNRRVRIPFPHTTDKNPFRVQVWREDEPIHYSVLVELQQRTKVTSWQIPNIIHTSNSSVVAKYTNTSKILCYDTDENLQRYLSEFEFGVRVISQMKRNFTISLSTISTRNITVFVYADIFDKFFIEDNVKYEFLASPSQPSYYSYDFPKNSTEKTVALRITSDAEACVVASLQPKFCPVRDLNHETVPGGYYQTVKSKGGLLIWRNWFPDGFFLVFNVKADNRTCNSLHLPTNESIYPNGKTIKISFEINNGNTKNDYNIATIVIVLIHTAVFLIFIFLIFFWYRFKTKAQFGRVLTGDNVDGRELRENKSMYYISQLFIIATFYCLPVIQLMVSYKQNVDDSGNLDKCYYNFLCSQPWYFNDFNHMFSNIGYVFLGITFLGVVRANKYYLKNDPNCGYPRRFGLYYAMALALVLEGVLSCAYHICPNQSNFQFDTSFMYVMIVLIIAKLYQNRHDNVNEGAHLLFSMVAVAIALVMFGILYESRIAMGCFIVLYLILCIYIGYKYLDIRFRRKGEDPNDFANLNPDVPEGDESIGIGYFQALEQRKEKRIFVLIIVASNIALALAWTIIFSYVDFGTYVLGILMTNAIIYCSYYIYMKYLNDETICKEAITYGVLSIIFWISAVCFFLSSVTQWSMTPAESRELNSDCILMGFYDTHDVWHLLSATALFFSFMFLLTLDEDLRIKPRDELKRF